ncbi:MAG TPA: diaminopimelate epimerase [Thermovirgaceae bacterium]|nr:diaminopimelate epimerase [Thermovirgaceae bacterium]
MNYEGLKFTKMQGNGNDFIIIDNRSRSFGDDSLRDMAINLCRRRISIGADGLMAIEKSDDADFKMRLFNCDGSEGEMCGNGARCLARCAFEKGIAPKKMTIETLAGPVSAQVTPPYATLDMGLLDMTSVERGQNKNISGEDFPYSHLTVGVPHTVIFQDPGDRRSPGDLAPIAIVFQSDRDLFPLGTNVNFLKVSGPNLLDVRTRERGVNDFTLSCGTGSTAAAAAAWMEGLVSSPVDVTNPGGVNTVLIEENEPGVARLFLRGLTAFVAEGSVLS